MTAPTPELGLYVHWPYCAAICPYCDFNVYRARDRDPGPLVDALLADLAAHRARLGPRPLVSVFLGGGTPSLLPPADVARLLEACDRLFGLSSDAEITLEANPTDAEAARFAAFAAAGINRLSLGIQSFDDAALKTLGRWHSATEARAALALAGATFRHVSLDLIYARPGQTPEQWEAELAEAVASGADHISPYQLTIEPGTAFDRAARRGALHVPDPDNAADLYDQTQAHLSAAGFEAYEVSNHARSLAARSRHNQLYWRSQDWIGLGPGAHGRLTLDGVRLATEAHRRPEVYQDAVAQSGSGLAEESELDPDAVREEFWLMGLRLLEGVAHADVARRGVAVEASRIETLVADGLIEVTRTHTRLTKRGRLLANSVTRALLV